MLRAAIIILLLAAHAHAGLYYSGETVAELPSQWRGFLLDQQTLRNVGVPVKPGAAAHPARVRYLEQAARLARKKDPTPDDVADLGALYVRLGDIPGAIAVLRPAYQKDPGHFRLAANLGTALQLGGDLVQAAACLEQAVRLAPRKSLEAEEYHLRLVQHRLGRGKSAGLDDLFGLSYVDEDGSYRPGKLAAAERKKLPAHAVAVVQQLALWLPADGPLLWQLAELAAVHGDVRNAAAMMDGCVIQFGMSDVELRRRRRAMRAAAGPAPTTVDAGKEEHSGHQAITFRSSRPLLTRLDAGPLPAIDRDGVNELPWPVIQGTLLDKQFHPTFPTYLSDLDGKQVRLLGFMQPLHSEAELTHFLFLEYPVGCWYCETPDTTSIVRVELAEGESTAYHSGIVKVIGRLELNRDDPESFLYVIRDARVSPVD